MASISPRPNLRARALIVVYGLVMVVLLLVSMPTRLSAGLTGDQAVIGSSWWSLVLGMIWSAVLLVAAWLVADRRRLPGWIGTLAMIAAIILIGGQVAVVWAVVGLPTAAVQPGRLALSVITNAGWSLLAAGALILVSGPTGPRRPWVQPAVWVTRWLVLGASATEWTLLMMAGAGNNPLGTFSDVAVRVLSVVLLWVWTEALLVAQTERPETQTVRLQAWCRWLQILAIGVVGLRLAVLAAAVLTGAYGPVTLSDLWPGNLIFVLISAAGAVLVGLAAWIVADSLATALADRAQATGGSSEAAGGV